MRSRLPWRGLLLILILAAAGIAVWLSPLGRRLDAGAMIDIARSYGNRWWTIPLYFIAYAVLDIFFIPTQFLSVLSVLMWGWLRGGTIELFAATLGALPPYLIARSTLRDWFMQRIVAQRRVADVLDREGFTMLLLLRVIPIIPYTPLNYLAGLSSVKPSRYLLATFIGMMPSTFIFAWFVQALADGVMKPRDVTIRALAAGALFALLIISTRLAAPRLRRKVASEGHTASPQDDARRDSDSPAQSQE